jgi:DnaK suppressor protein
MPTSTIADYQTILEVKRAELRADAHKRDEIRIEHAADELDNLQLQLNRELVLHQLDLGSSVLRQVEAALARIRSGEFGLCLGCDKSIPARRLQVVPWAAYCVACQEQVDQFARKHSSDGHFVAVDE